MSQTGISSLGTQPAKAKQNFTWLLTVETICPRISQATDRSISLEVMGIRNVSPVAQDYELRMSLGGCPSMQIPTRCHETQRPQNLPGYLDHIWTIYLSKCCTTWTSKKSSINWKLKKKSVTFIWATRKMNLFQIRAFQFLHLILGDWGLEKQRWWRNLLKITYLLSQLR